MTGSLAPHATPLLCPKTPAFRRLRTEGPHAEISDFSPGSFSKFSTPVNLPGGHWAEFPELICALEPRGAATAAAQRTTANQAYRRAGSLGFIAPLLSGREGWGGMRLLSHVSTAFIL